MTELPDAVRRAMIASFCLGTLHVPSVFAQSSTYPVKPVRIIVPASMARRPTRWHASLLNTSLAGCSSPSWWTPSRGQLASLALQPWPAPNPMATR